MRRLARACFWPIVAVAFLLSAVQPAQAVLVLCTAQSSAIDTVVTQNSGVYHYQFTLTNTSQCGAGMGSPVIVDFELPLLSAESVYNITSPGSWDYQIYSSAQFSSQFGIANPFASPYVLHWYDTLSHPSENGLTPANLSESIVPIGFEAAYQRTDVYENSATGFSFYSLTGPVAGPYESSWLTSGRTPGDPPVPGSPVSGALGGAGLPSLSPDEESVPEPAAFLLVAAGLGVLSLRRWKQRS